MRESPRRIQLNFRTCLVIITIFASYFAGFVSGRFVDREKVKEAFFQEMVEEIQTRFNAPPPVESASAEHARLQAEREQRANAASHPRIRLTP